MAIYQDTALDRTFQALGDGTRRGMLALLAEKGAQTAGELGDPFDIAQPTASKHLKVLESAGLVSREIDGRIHRFTLAPMRLEQAQDWLETHQEFWERTLDRLDQFLKTTKDSNDE